ncbi:MAG: hypothetical protein GXP17_05505 [Gammaproteobacteria bacterium]|nr:hypothetical protein [Gammaproteobacteria bacterium]
MHAVIQIVSFLVLGTAVSVGDGQLLLASTLLVVPLYLVSGWRHWPQAWKMLARLRWLFLSMLIVYLFFTPGQLLWPGLEWSPTVEGLGQGLLRIGSLVLLVLAVNLLIAGSEQAAFLSAIVWCLRPLRIIGLQHERLAVRLTLALDAVSEIRSGDRVRGKATTKQGSKIQAIVQTATRLFGDAETRARSVVPHQIVLPEETHPPLIQWLIPLALAILFIAIKIAGSAGFGTR